MLRAPVLALFAVVSLGICAPGVATAQQAFEPGPQNDPEKCRDLWEAIGLPEHGDTDRDTTLVCHARYVLSHSNADKTPDWVIERLTREQASGTNKRPKVKFKSEGAVPAEGRAADTDYAGSKFDRGHQAPSEDFNAKAEWMVESFILSNAVPQIGPGFNQGIWKELEALVRKLAIERGELYVITGPIYQDPEGRTLTVRKEANACRNEIKMAPLKKAAICDANDKNYNAVCESGVAVPVGLYKIIYDPGNKRANAYIMPNVDHRDGKRRIEPLEYLKQYRTTIHMVEEFTGLRFFSELSRRERRVLTEHCGATMLH